MDTNNNKVGILKGLDNFGVLDLYLDRNGFYTIIEKNGMCGHEKIKIKVIRDNDENTIIENSKYKVICSLNSVCNTNSICNN